MTRPKALELFTPPFSVDRIGDVCDATGKVVCVIPISNKIEECIERGQFIAAALTNEWDKLKKEDA